MTGLPCLTYCRHDRLYVCVKGEKGVGAKDCEVLMFLLQPASGAECLRRLSQVSWRRNRTTMTLMMGAEGEGQLCFGSPTVHMF